MVHGFRNKNGADLVGIHNRTEARAEKKKRINYSYLVNILFCFLSLVTRADAFWRAENAGPFWKLPKMGRSTWQKESKREMERRLKFQEQKT